MNQEKIGKLIAKLRKEKGLTQQQLGDMVGVGYRAVSKWETGLTLPDISNINELCQILGITSDELLKGELKESTPEKSSKKTKRKFIKPISIIAIILIIIFIITGYLLPQKTKTYEYNLKTGNRDEYLVEGKITFKGNKMSIYINKIEFQDYNFSQTIINNFQYSVSCGGVRLFLYGYNPEHDILYKKNTISQAMEEFVINYKDIEKVTKSEILDNGLTLEITFINDQYQEIQKQILIVVVPEKSN